MADIELVIKIPEEYYNDICNSETASNYSVLYALDGIRKGTPLPERHGRLIDADKTILKICGSSCGCHLEECGNDNPCYSVARISSASTIIEADKAERETEYKVGEECSVNNNRIRGNAMNELDKLQKEVWKNKVNRGWDKTDLNTELLLTYGELNEAFQAKTNENFKEEIADVGIYLLGIAEKQGFSLFDEMKKKHDYNVTRVLGYEKE